MSTPSQMPLDIRITHLLIGRGEDDYDVITDLTDEDIKDIQDLSALGLCMSNGAASFFRTLIRYTGGSP